MLFRPEYRRHLEHPLVHAHHGLLVELGGLGQIGLAAEVVQLEDVGASLRARVDDLGGVNLRKALSGQIIPEAPDDSLLNFEHAALAQVAQHHWAKREFRI